MDNNKEFKEAWKANIRLHLFYFALIAIMVFVGAWVVIKAYSNEY